MDDLEFRRQLYASPRQHNSDIKQAILRDPNKRQFADEMLDFEQKLEQVYQVDVPEDLASRIILKQSIDKQKQSDQKKNRWYIGIAASVAFLVGLTVNSGLNPLLSQSTPDLASLMIEHAQQDMIHHFSSPEKIQSAQVSLTNVNQKLNGFGAQLNGDFATIRSVNFCQMRDVRALHLIVQGETGLVNIFIMHPIKSIDTLPSIQGDILKGQGQRYPSADLMYIGNKTEDLSKIQQKFEQELKWRT